MVLNKFLSPKNDIAFKKIFGTEKNKDILIHFLNDVIDFNGRGQIQDVIFLKSVQDPEIRIQKTSIVDILCKDEKGNQYIVEMQVAKEKGFTKRAQFYAAKAYASQIYVGGEFHTLKAVIFLAIADFIMFADKVNYKSDHVILDKESYENDLKDFSFTFLELPKFKKGIDSLSNTTEMWAYFFKHAEETSEEDLQKLIEHEEIIAKAYKELDRYSWNEEELRTYEQAEKYEQTYYASMAQKFDDGVLVGEKKSSLRIAENMLKKGFKVQDIEESTGLSEQEITPPQQDYQSKRLHPFEKRLRLRQNQCSKLAVVQ